MSGQWPCAQQEQGRDLVESLGRDDLPRRHLRPTGRNLDGTAPDLRPGDLDFYPHRSLVSDRDNPDVVRIWLLNHDATPDAIHRTIMDEAARLVLAGKGILILARRPEPKVDVWTGLLYALDLFTAPPEAGGRA